MDVRYLGKEERIRTRSMWEEVFSSDSSAFVDYYYTHKASQNEILVIEEDSEIHAMLQMNPYDIFTGGQTWRTRYIVGVATDPGFRHRGYMRILLHRMLKDMYGNGEAFTFLMPAAEAIYRPFDFRFVYDQGQCRIGMEKISPAIEMLKKRLHGLPAAKAVEAMDCRQFEETDSDLLAEFLNRILEERYGVFARRDTLYYRTLLAEAASENGGILLFMTDERLSGYCVYALGDAVEVREPVCEKGQEAEFAAAMLERLKIYDRELHFIGIEDIFFEEMLSENGGMVDAEKKPMIMARIVDLKQFASCLRADGPVAFKIRVTDGIIRENDRTFWFRSDGDGKLLLEETSESGDFEAGIGVLTAFLFGYISAEEFVAETEACRSGTQSCETPEADKFLRELANIKGPGKLFLNEIV